MMKNPTILGLGTAAMDIVLNCEDLPRNDGFAFIHREQLMAGGSCANVLVALEKLGHDSGLIAKLGDDHFAEAFLADLFQNNIHSAYVIQKPNGITLHTYITVANNGEKSIFAHLGNSLLELTADEVDISWLEGVSVFYTDMFPGKPALKLARACREHKIPVVFNLQTSVSFMDMCGVPMSEIEEMLNLCSLFITSREGLHELNQHDEAEGAADFLQKKHQITDGVIVTLGDDGAIWADGNQTIKAPSFPVDANDTTGAGDAFTGGMIHSYFLEGKSGADSLLFAVACAALKCTLQGPRFNVDLKTVQAFIESKVATK